MCCSSEQGLIIIILAVTNILAVIVAVGSTLNFCNWLNMFYFETRYFSSITVRHDGGKFLENFSTIKKLVGAVSRTSAQFTNEVRNWTGKLGSTQLSELMLEEFSIRSRRFYEIKLSIDHYAFNVMLSRFVPTKPKNFLDFCILGFLN